MKKYYVVFIAFMAIASSCVHQSGYDGYQAAKNRELVNDLFKAFNKHDFKSMASYYADTAKFLDPSLAKEYVHQTHQQTEAKYNNMAKMFPDLKDSTTNIIATPDQVVTQFTSSGKSTDGKSFSLPLCTVFSLKDGKIISDATYYDNKGQ